MVCLGVAADALVCCAQIGGAGASGCDIDGTGSRGRGWRGDSLMRLRIIAKRCGLRREMWMRRLVWRKRFARCTILMRPSRLLEQARREHPKSAAPLAMLGDLDLELQTYDAAIAHLTAALAIEPANVDARNRLAVAYKAKGGAADKADGARADRESAGARSEECAGALHAGGDLCGPEPRRLGVAGRGESGGAAAAEFARASAAGEDFGARAGGSFGGGNKIALRASGAGAGAACERGGDCVRRRRIRRRCFCLSRAYRCAGQDEKAAATLEEFEKSSQNDRTTKENQTQAKHLVQQADELAMKNDFAGSLAVLQQAIAMDATYPGAYSQLAKLYYSAGDIEKASDAIGQALARAPYHPEYLYVQGKILEKQGKMDDALGAFQQTVLVNPKESDAYFEMGAIYQQRGERAKARAAYARAVEISPEDPDYKRALAGLSGGAAATP